MWGEEGSGKSELLQNSATLCDIPMHWKGVWQCGRGQHCVPISTDYKVAFASFGGNNRGSVEAENCYPAVPLAIHIIKKYWYRSLSKIGSVV